jgi:hypothetical protein
MNMPTSAPQTEAMIVTITPELAKQWLELNIEGNRSIKKAAIDQYAVHMRNNEWPLTGQPIIFNGNQLIDGQNRLHACIKAGVSFRSLVVRNVDVNAFEYIDLGAKRSMSDALKFRNHTNVNQMASMVRVVIAYEKRFTSLAHVDRVATRQQLIDEIESNREIYESGAKMAFRAHANGFLKSSAGAIYVLVSKDFSQDAAACFMNPAIEGTNLKHNDPRLALRRYVARTKSSSLEQLSAWIKACNAFSSGKGLQKIYAYKSGDSFPTLNKMKENTNVIR